MNLEAEKPDSSSQEEITLELGIGVLKDNLSPVSAALDLCGSYTRRHKDNLSPLRAALQLCGSLTRRHKLALHFFRDVGLKKLLESCEVSTFETELAIIIRHIIEDRVTLQHAMEVEIQRYMCMHKSEDFLWSLVSNFLGKMAPVVSRDPIAFLEAASSTCQLESSWDDEDPYVLLSKDRSSKECLGEVPVHFSEVIHELVKILMHDLEYLRCDYNSENMARAAFLVKVLGDMSVVYMHALETLIHYDDTEGFLKEIVHWWDLLVNREKAEGEENFFKEVFRFMLVVCNQSREGTKKIINNILEGLLKDKVRVTLIYLDLVRNIFEVCITISDLPLPMIEILKLVDPRDEEAPKIFTSIFECLQMMISGIDGETDSILFDFGDGKNYFSLREPLSFQHQCHREFHLPLLLETVVDAPQICSSNIACQFIKKLTILPTQQQDLVLPVLPVDVLRVLSFDNLKEILKTLRLCPVLELDNLQNLLDLLSEDRDTGADLVRILLDEIRAMIQTWDDYPLLMRVVKVLTSLVTTSPTVLDSFLVSSEACEGKEIPVLFIKLINTETSYEQLHQVMQLLQSVVNRATSLPECQILSQLSQSDLGKLCSILGLEGLKDAIYSLAKDVLKKLVGFHHDFLCQTLLQMAKNLSEGVSQTTQAVTGLLKVLCALLEEDDILKSTNLEFEPFCNSLSECIRNFQLSREAQETRWLVPLIKLFFYLGEKVRQRIEEGHENETNTFVKFVEGHSKLLNEIIRGDLTLLENSFSLMLKTPHLIDLANKKPYLKKLLRDIKTSTKLQIRVHRENVFEDSYKLLNSFLPDRMLGDLSVIFRGERGIDVGGLTREWYQLMSKDILRLKLFTAVEKEVTYQPNPKSSADLSYYRFIGCMLAKALVDGHLMDFELTTSCYKHILGARVTFDDLRGLDSDLHNGLIWYLKNKFDDIMQFTDEIDGEVYDLKANGRNIAVTEANKREFVDLKAANRMTTAIEKQLNEFIKGFHDLVPQEVISILSHEDLKLLTSGTPSTDVNALRNSAIYGEGYTEDSPVVQWLWELLWSLGKVFVARFLGFVTGTRRVPSEGFVELKIFKASGDTDRLPVSHTCDYRIDIPEYSSKEILEKKLTLAVECEGFDFG